MEKKIFFSFRVAYIKEIEQILVIHVNMLPLLHQALGLRRENVITEKKFGLYDGDEYKGVRICAISSLNWNIKYLWDQKFFKTEELRRKFIKKSQTIKSNAFFLCDKMQKNVCISLPFFILQLSCALLLLMRASSINFIQSVQF